MPLTLLGLATSLGDLLLDLPGLGLKAHVNDLVLLVSIELDDATSVLLRDLGATVGKTSTLDLQLKASSLVLL